MERRLCVENSVESVGLLQSVVKQLKVMKTYIAANTESTPIDADNFTQNSSIPSEEEEDDGCLDFDLLIPSFFFYEEEDLSDEVSFHPNEVRGTYSSCEKHQSLKELVIHHSGLLSKDCSPILSDYSRSIFDREVHVDGKLFVELPESIACHLGSDKDDFLVLHKTSKMSYKLLIDECLFMDMNFARWIYDRGKVFDVLKEYFSFAVTYRIGIDTMTSCEVAPVGSILLGNYKEELVNELILKHGSQVVLLVDTWIVSVLMIVSNGMNNKMIAALPERNKFLLLMSARVASIKKVHKGSVQMLSVIESEEDYITTTELYWKLLRAVNSSSDHKYSCFIPPWSLNIREEDMSTSAKFFRVDLFRVIIDRQEGDVHHILLRESQKLSVLIFSAYTIARTRLYLLRIYTYPLSPEVYGRYMIQEKVVLKVLQSNCSFLYTFKFTLYLLLRCNQLA
ncbi:uncharacterized protein LOC113298035 isoform X1 [Papaver somniferum]|uniref:uncharacterized protein LOC113298035 isoform X1 n=1 Tax=Papaver somniferum TaxID=3469 RepID=UPI000E6FEE70|nr:uncharacterized protein LOC113298035 isoform X1 [Papaver somniferum]